MCEGGAWRELYNPVEAGLSRTPLRHGPGLHHVLLRGKLESHGVPSVSGGPLTVVMLRSSFSTSSWSTTTTTPALVLAPGSWRRTWRSRAVWSTS